MENMYENEVIDLPWISSSKELEVFNETEKLGKIVSIYKEDDNIDKIDEICDKCIKKIIELHNDKPIIVDNETIQFENSYLSSYYAFVIMEAYDCDPIDVVNIINKYKNNKKK